MASIDSVNDLPPRVQYVASAAQTVFPYPYPIFNDADLVVDRDGVTAALNVDYTVSGEGDDLGGDVTWIGTAFAGGEIVTIYRDIAIERDTDISQNGPWSSTAYNDEQDKVFLILQQLKARLARSIRLPIIAEVADSDLEIVVANFANKYLTFDADGKPTPAALSATTMTQSTIGALLYPRTASEITAGIIPASYGYTSHEVSGFVLPERYGAIGNGNAADAGNGAIDTAAIAKAITIAAATKCPILLSRPYIAVPATASTQEAHDITVAWLLQTNLRVLGVGGASITLANNRSTDASPQNLALFHTNSVLSNISFQDVIFDLNGANNLVSPGRPAVYDNTKNMAAISVSGTPAGIAARVNDVLIEGCTFKNCPGVCVLVCGQSNIAGVTLGERWTIRNNLFLNNGTDAQDHTSIFAWCNTVTCSGNIFWEDTPPHTVGKTGGATCYEVHGSNHRLTGNYFVNYTLGCYVASNFSQPVVGTVVANNDFYCSDYGILLFRQQIPASAAVDGVLIEGNSFYFDNWTYAGQPNTRAAVRFQGQLGAPQQLAINNVKITGNYAIAAGTGLYSNFVRWDTVTIIGAQVCSNLSITDNQVIGFTEGVYVLTNAANGMGKTTISRNEFINLTPDGLGNPPRGIHVNANGGFTTLIIDGNEFTDERGAPTFDRGIYLDTGTITSLYLGRQIYKGLTVANYAENGGLAVTNWLGPALEGVAVIPYSANMTPDWSAGTCHTITVTDAVAHTLNLPTRAKDGDVFQLTLRNTTGGAIGAITFNANYGKSAWTQPATLQNRSIAFRKGGAIWTQINQTGVDVPN